MFAKPMWISHKGITVSSLTTPCMGINNQNHSSQGVHCTQSGLKDEKRGGNFSRNRGEWAYFAHSSLSLLCSQHDVNRWIFKHFWRDATSSNWNTANFPLVCTVPDNTKHKQFLSTASALWMQTVTAKAGIKREHKEQPFANNEENGIARETVM